MDPVRPDDDFLVFGKPVLGEDEIEEVVDTLEAGWLSTGPKVQTFKNEFGEYIGADHLVAVNSCTAALHLALESMDLEPDDEVIVPAMTFCASVNTVIHAGATPVLADVRPETWNLDPDDVKNKITDRTRAIMPVHYTGRLCAMERIQSIADEYDLAIVEDCAHAIETEKNGKHAGTFGDFGCFSFYATKNLAMGEGGMLVCPDEETARELSTKALHGMSAGAWSRYDDSGFDHYDVVDAGFKYNMMDMQAALGLRQLEKIDAFWERRLALWKQYDRKLSELSVQTPPQLTEKNRHGLHLYTVLIDEDKAGIGRDRVLSKLNEHNIGTGVHYLSIPEYSYYQEQMNWSPDNYPIAKKIGRETISLPLTAGMDATDVDNVVEALERVLR